jgi:hypothetical protein
MPALFDDPEHWRSRAEEARVVAEQLSDPEAKRTMLRIATDYDRLAEHVNCRQESNRRSRDSTSPLKSVIARWGTRGDGVGKLLPPPFLLLQAQWSS